MPSKIIFEFPVCSMALDNVEPFVLNVQQIFLSKWVNGLHTSVSFYKYTPVQYI